MDAVDLTQPVGPDDHAIGAPDAPVVLVEYGDYECPLCGRAHAVLQEALERLGDRVRYVFRNFPLTDLHPHAQAAAEAAESVAAHGGNDAFWDMHDMLFTNQDALSIDDLLGYAEAAGVEVDAVATDLSLGTGRPRVDADTAAAHASGATGTPTFFINGRRYAGNWSDPESFVADLDRAAHHDAPRS